ncbi:TetR/AcrR family transcriptional regulator [Geosporobacter ferrireducens]|uniref:HTH tetR-type domain-containing protein n=1 Tax=Geosporobacter ferrireducens TaxID=1424294 RepID=A0A1D8GJ39_9FIRM|nr:TetR/AcrR family transcriptional regulator [Geosporobacter ferrireducens]AOT70931.1 hypothetical protein Gferi_15995 [Geosporobacter ferrireducens]MTI53642.1 TetR/AcrR family transcriptional regulator [Geosporobacter ferrireducens]
MQILKDEINEKILKAAKTFFLDIGFEKASMSMIAKEAGVSKSNLYNYFSSKEEIFYALTEEAYIQINNTMENLLRHDSEDCFQLEKFTALMTKELIVLLTKYREEILLILDRSIGTKFENAKEEIIHRLEKHMKWEFKQYHITLENEDWFFAHYISTSLIEGLLEIIRHNQSDMWIQNNVKMLVGYYIYGYSYFFADSIS